MKLLKINIHDMPRFKGDIDIDFIARQRVDEDDNIKNYFICNKFVKQPIY